MCGSEHRSFPEPRKSHPPLLASPAPFWMLSSHHTLLSHALLRSMNRKSVPECSGVESHNRHCCRGGKATPAGRRAEAGAGRRSQPGSPPRVLGRSAALRGRSSELTELARQAPPAPPGLNSDERQGSAAQTLPWGRSDRSRHTRRGRGCLVPFLPFQRNDPINSSAVTTAALRYQESVSESFRC